MLDTYKELEPVLYGENAIKHLPLGPTFRNHWHDRIEMLYVTHGSFQLQLGDEQMILLPGQLAVISPRVLHTGTVLSEDSCGHVIMFDVEKFFNGAAASEKYLLPVCKGESVFSGVISDPETTEKFEQLCNAVTGQIHPLYTIGLVYQLFGLLYQNCASSGRVLHSVDPRFAEVLDFVNAHYTEKISAQTISQRFSYNKSYFCRRFKEISGMTVTEYIQILRIERAQKLLKSTQMPIADMAWSCGFADAPHFTRCFKKQTGMTPKQFRRAGPAPDSSLSGRQ